MAAIIDVQKIAGGKLPSQGKVYIGLFGDNEPETNPIAIFSDVAGTVSVNNTSGVLLDLDGYPTVDGQRISLYSTQDYSLQIRDKFNAKFWPDARQFEISEGVFNPGSSQTITGRWGFDISASNEFYISDADPFIEPTTLSFIVNKSATSKSLQAFTNEEATTSGSGAGFEVTSDDATGSLCRITASSIAITVSSDGNGIDIAEVSANPITDLGIANKQFVDDTHLRSLKSFTLSALPSQLAGAQIYVSDATGASLTGSQCFSNGSVWVDVTTGAAVV